MHLVRLGIFLSVLVIAGCTSASHQSNSGYGAFPDRPRTAVLEASSESEARILGKPDPYFIRYEDRWHYGWRVCARITPRERPAFFLLRGNTVVTWVAADENPESIASRRVAQYCGSYFDDRAAASRRARQLSSIERPNASSPSAR